MSKRNLWSSIILSLTSVTILGVVMPVSANEISKDEEIQSNIQDETPARMQAELKQKGFTIVPKSGTVFSRAVTSEPDNEDTVEPVIGTGRDSSGKDLQLNLSQGKNGGLYYQDDSTQSDRITTVNSTDNSANFLYFHLIFQGPKVSPYANEYGNIVKNMDSNFQELTDEPANTAIDQFHKNNDYFKQHFNWDSFDNGTDALVNKEIITGMYGKISGVDLSMNAANGYGRGFKTSVTVFGKGGEIKDPSTGTVKYTFGQFDNDRFTVAHEYSHGVIRQIVPFSTANPETAALNEGLPDVFAAAITGKWSMGEDILNVAYDNSSFRRDLSNPAKYNMPNDPTKGYPVKYSDLTAGIDGHYGGTIIGHQFYLLSEGGDFNGIDTQGIGRDKAINIVFHSLSKLTKESTFKDYRNAMESSASELYGTNSSELDAVVNSMNASELPK